MNHGVVSHADVAKFGGRFDARYLLMCKEHEALYDELVAQLTKEELCDLAQRLPYNQQIADVLRPRGVVANHQSSFMRWLLGEPAESGSYMSATWRPPRPPLPGQPKRVLAVYCAAAAQYTASIMLERVLALSQQKKLILDDLLALMNFGAGKDLVRLREAMKRGGKEKLEEVKPGGSALNQPGDGAAGETST